MKFPSFDETRCQSLTLSGELHGISRGERKHLIRREQMIARYKTGKTSAYIRVLGSPSGKHFHVDTAPAQSFQRRPKVTHSLTDIRNVFARLEGHKINVRVSGQYSAAVDEVRESFRSTFEDTSKSPESARIRVTSVAFAIEDSPLQSIRFFQKKANGQIGIELDMLRVLTIDDDYLTECLAIVDKAFTSLLQNLKEPE